MRVHIDIDDSQIGQLDRLARRDSRLRTDIIQQALRDYLDAYAVRNADDSFGLWGRRAIDGLEYQERARRGW